MKRRAKAWGCVKMMASTDSRADDQPGIDARSVGRDHEARATKSKSPCSNSLPRITRYHG